jgi:FMN phosphatase YigB (HAD superfamily)
MTYTWLLFDADGTLFDYDQAEATALEQRPLQKSARPSSRRT